MRPLLRILPLLLLAACGSCRAGKTQLSAPACQLVEDGFGPAGTVPITVEVIAEGLEVPWGIAWLPGGDALVTERPGRIRLLRNFALQPTPVATLQVGESTEGGLLGIAAHPQFADNRQFYVYLTHQDGEETRNRVERWVLSEDHQRATFERVIFGGIRASTYHNGGRLRFGPDGMLYVGTGDAREPDLAQNPDAPEGKLLRLTPEGEVPSDNPFPGKPAFLLGVRNTQGFDWKDAGTLYFTDHGPSGERMLRGHDEVSVARKGDNLGWPTVYRCESSAGLVTPALTWHDAVPPGGAALYTGSAIPEWKDSLLIGTLGSRHLHRVVFSPENPSQVAQHEVYLDNTHGRLRETLMGPDGHLYVTTSNCDGRGSCGPRQDLILRVRR
ncbi:Glucose/arabinose dehydrogenase, beta-propeller fold [Stigmatella aurantiaca]|uniref:Glucose/arabinose dehydrogenase, beta-propeller fold n=1 Tax=Stigmatella aurantiaca TaxID=41 RepID=A0A1H7QLN6_STIAU|nr:PQQ-dependent sugar dehydrogenase [Stigmatella aurantiaca]SEL48177.1 Glucose/arabinose dehydrogenase, beta-propeller fold [Stigmatella aurantiaca]